MEDFLCIRISPVAISCVLYTCQPAILSTINQTKIRNTDTHAQGLCPIRNVLRECAPMAESTHMGHISTNPYPPHLPCRKNPQGRPRHTLFIIHRPAWNLLSNHKRRKFQVQSNTTTTSKSGMSDAQGRVKYAQNGGFHPDRRTVNIVDQASAKAELTAKTEG